MPRIHPAAGHLRRDDRSRNDRLRRGDQGRVRPSARVSGPSATGGTASRRFRTRPTPTAATSSTSSSPRCVPPRPPASALVDVLDVHWYPEAQGGGVRITEDRDRADAVVAAPACRRRGRCGTPTYVETSWITQDARVGAIRLLPRLREKIDAHYPGTRLAITEYNYGGGDHISGAHRAGRRCWASSAARACSPPPSGSLSGRQPLHRRGASTRSATTTAPGAASATRRSRRPTSDHGDGLGLRERRRGRPRGDRRDQQERRDESADLPVTHPVDLRAKAYAVTSASASMVRAENPTRTGRNAFRVTLPGASVTTIALTR